MSSVGYAQMMADLDLEEGRDAEQDEIRVRCSKRLKLQLEGLAQSEERARQLRGKTGKVSLNRLATLILERYVVAFAADHKVPVPASEDDKEAVDRAARAINARRQREGRAKSE